MFYLTAQSQNGITENETELIGSVSFGYDKSNLDDEDKTSLLKLIDNFSNNNIVIK